MSTSFDVNHNGFNEANQMLAQQLRTVRMILDNLGNSLRNLPEAMDGIALPLYEEDQRQWNARYLEAANRLSANTNASVNVQEIFKGGDVAGGRIMLS